MAAPYHPGVEMLNGNVDTQLTVNGITGGLLLRMKLCGVAAVIASSPYWLYQTWAFILPGLHPQEKRWGLLAVIDGQPLKAEGELLEALRIQRAFRDTVGLALTLECLAWSSAAIGDGERAATLRGGTENAWHTIGATDILMHGRRTRDLLAARSRFWEGAYETARQRGRGRSKDHLKAHHRPGLCPSAPGGASLGPATHRLHHEGVESTGAATQSRLADPAQVTCWGELTRCRFAPSLLDFGRRQTWEKWGARSR